MNKERLLDLSIEIQQKAREKVSKINERDFWYQMGALNYFGNYSYEVAERIKNITDIRDLIICILIAFGKSLEEIEKGLNNYCWSLASIEAFKEGARAAKNALFNELIKANDKEENK